MTSAAIVNLQGISKIYPKDIVALNSINLTVDSPEMIGIMGANGSGKSTLLKILAGHLKPDQGTSHIFQQETYQVSEALKKQISYISQDKALDPEMTGKELLFYFSTLYGLSAASATQRINQLIDTFELDGFIHRYVKTCSGGQAQRLHLAIGIIHQPPLLLLDEPTSALDPQGNTFFWDFIQSYQQQGNTVIVVSHELANIRQHCSRVLLLNKGQLIASGSPDTIIQTYATPILHITTAEKPYHKEALKALLQQNIPTATVQLKGQSTRLDIKQQEKPISKDSQTSQFPSLDKAKILASALQIFEEQQQSVIECRWEQPSLESAYFKLTGENITAPTPLKKNKKGQRKHR